jgi:hypothetical protein
MKKVLVVCVGVFNGHELWPLLRALESEEIAYEVIGTRHLLVDEVTGINLKVDRTLPEVDPRELDGVQLHGLAIASGPPEHTLPLWFNPSLLKMLGAANHHNLPIAGICCAAAGLAPVAIGRRISFFPLIRCRTHAEEFGAIPSGVALCRDGNILTAEYQMVAGPWAREFCLMVKDPDAPSKIVGLVPSGYIPQGRPRRNPPALQRLIDASVQKSKSSQSQ